MRRLLVVLGLILPLAAGVSCAADERFFIATKRDDDKVEVQARQDEVRFDVRSPFGISQARVERTAEHWPGKVSVRLRLKGLESLKLQVDTVRLEASVSSHDGSTRLWIADHEAMPLTEAHRYWMPISILDSNGQRTKRLPLNEGWFDFTLPQAMLAANPQAITLQWVDFYRN